MQLDKVSEITGALLVQGGTFDSLGTLDCVTFRMLSFAEDARYLSQIRDHEHLSCLICTQDVLDSLERNLGVIVSEAPRSTFFQFHNWLVDSTEFYRTQAPSRIDPSASIHPTAVIAGHNVRIGAKVSIDANVVLYPNTTLDDQVVLRANVTIGGSGFEFKRIGDEILSVAHGGGVHLHPRVEILGNSHIARGVFGTDTVVGEQTRIDALVNISHNVRIGRRCLIAANSAISGSATVGDDVWIGPGVTVSHAVKIGDRSHISLGSVVVTDVEPEARVTGNFAIPHQKFLINHVKGLR